MKTLTTSVLFCFIVIATYSQDAITGTIPDWSGGAGEVAVMLMGPPEIVGTLDAEGRYRVPLKPDYLDEVRQRIEAVNKEDTGGWTAQLNTLEGRFSCTDGDLEVTNAGQAVTGFPVMGAFTLVNMQEEEILGYLMYASSESFMKSMAPYTFEPGFYIEWYFVEEAAEISGTCSVTSYAMNQEETYEHTTIFDLNFNPGWNIVKYEIEDVYTDKEGNSYPMVESYSTLAELPESTQVLFTAD